jgi:hypothetical protein
VSAYDKVMDAVRAAGLRTFESNTGARAQCPGHQSRGLSLALRPATKDDGPIGLKCFAGCEAREVLESIGLTLKDLYEPKDKRTWTPSRPRPKPTPFSAMIPDPEHFADRVIQQEAAEASPEYWDYRADQLALALPRPTDRLGIQPTDTHRLNASITACRNHAELLRGLR